MAVFNENSRYVRHATVYQAVDRRGRTVRALSAAAPPPQPLLGEHLVKEGQRLDHLASFYLQDANGFWRIAEINGAVLPDALAQARALRIPTRR